MGIFNRRNKEEKETRDYSAISIGSNFFDLIGDDKTNSTALACKSIIANSISTLPVSLLFKTNTDGFVKAYNHDLYRLVKYRPNNEEPPVMFYSRLALQMLDGNAYIYKDIVNGKVQALYILNNELMEVKRDSLNRKVFIYNSNVLDNFKVIHIPNIFYNGFKGQSVLEYAKKTMEISNTLDDYSMKAFKNKISNRLLVDISEMYPDTTPEQVEEIGKYISNNYAGEDNIGKPVIAFNKMKVDEIKNSSGDISNELVSNRKLQRNLIAELYNVPISFLGDGKPTEEENKYFLKYTLLPYIIRIEQHLSLGLLSAYESERYFFKIKTEGFLRTDYKDRMEGYVKGLNNGIYSIDEIRQLENLKELPDELGKNRFIPANMMPLKKDVIDAYMASAKKKQNEIETGIGDDKK